MDYRKIMDELYTKIRALDDHGAVATYIPELARIDPDKFGVCLTTVDNETFGAGDYLEKFSLQSIVKVLTLCLAYKLFGERIWERLGYEPSGTGFNSLVQLESDKGIPRNPLINAGALVICDMLLSELEDPKTEFLAFLRSNSENPDIDYSSHIAESEAKLGYVNIALCNFIKSFGNIHNRTEDVLDFYFNICSIELSCRETSRLFLFLANHGTKTSGAMEQVLTLSQAKRINAIMQTCGFYDESGDFAYRVGLPGKSGVGGGIAAVHPGLYSICVWSPGLNEKGNSRRGVTFLEQFTTRTQLSIF